MSKQVPMLFSAAMVRANRAGLKWQTRRVINPQPEPGQSLIQHGDEWLIRDVDGAAIGDRDKRLKPRWVRGDTLWVRETWADVNSDMGPSLLYRADGALRGWQDFSHTFGPDYGVGPSMDYESYPGQYVMWWSDLWGGAPDHKWRPSIHMPRWACRNTYTVTGVRAERLLDISEEDAIAEGIVDHSVEGLPMYEGQCHVFPTAREAYFDIYDSIYGAGAAAKSPWLWVIEYDNPARAK